MAISDGVVIGIVLGLIFAAVSYYLFTRQTQLERKVGLMENILLDLRVTTEQALVSATEPEEHEEHLESPSPSYKEYSTLDTVKSVEEERPSSPKETQQYVNATEAETVSRDQEKEQTSISNNYESMTYKELTQIARQKGISGLRNMSKAQVIEALRGLEGGSTSSSSSQNAGTTVPLSAWMTEEADEKIHSEELSSANDTLGQHFSTFNDDAVEVSLVGSD
jgi:hypothetical protein